MNNYLFENYGIKSDLSTKINVIQHSIQIPIFGKKYYAPKDGVLMGVKVIAMFFAGKSDYPDSYYILEWADGTKTTQKSAIFNGIYLFETPNAYKAFLENKNNGYVKISYTELHPILEDMGYTLTKYDNNGKKVIQTFIVDKKNLNVRNWGTYWEFFGIDANGFLMKVDSFPLNNAFGNEKSYEIFFNKDNATASLMDFDVVDFEDNVDKNKEYTISVDIKVNAKSYEDAVRIAKNARITANGNEIDY